MLTAHLANFSPDGRVQLSAVDPERRALGFETPTERFWLTLRGAYVAPAARSIACATAFRDGLHGHAAPRSPHVANPPGPHFVRAQRSRDATFVEVETKYDVRQLYVERAGSYRLLRPELSNDARVEAIGDGRAVLIDPAPTPALAIVAADGSELQGPLPAALVPIARAWEQQPAYRFLAYVPELDVLVWCGGGLAAWMPAAPLRMARPGELGIRYEAVWPRRDPERRLAGRVTLSKYGRTVVQTERGVVSIHRAGFDEGERIELQGLVWDHHGVSQWEAVRRADQRPIALWNCAPPGDEAFVLRCSEGAAAIPMRNPLSDREMAELARLQSIGLFAGIDEAFLDAFAARVANAERPLAAVLDAYATYRSDRADRLARAPLSIAELSALAGNVPKEATRPAPFETHEECVAAANAELKLHGDARRWIAIATVDPEEPLFVLATPEQQRALAAADVIG